MAGCAWWARLFVAALLFIVLFAGSVSAGGVPLCKDKNGRTLIGRSLCGAKAGNSRPNSGSNDDGVIVRKPQTRVIPFLSGKRRGLYWVRTVVNDLLAANFIIDTGASVVQIPQDMFDKLVALGTVGKEDVLGFGTARIADGSTLRQQIVLLKRIQIGDYTLGHIQAMVGKTGVPPLLGTPVLEKLGKWRIDTERMALIVTGFPGEMDSAAVSSPRGADKLTRRCTVMHNNLRIRFSRLI